MSPLLKPRDLKRRLGASHIYIHALEIEVSLAYQQIKQYSLPICCAFSSEEMRTN